VDLANENASPTKIVQLVGRDRTVLDVGCAHGYVAQALRAQGCTVVGVERDPDDARRAAAHCDAVVVRDLDDPAWFRELAERRFDVIVFSDVLEHLRDPGRVLRDARALLVPGTGFVIASIPNVAHVSVRLELLLGSFRRETLGILDATHLHFFTRDTVAELFAEAGLPVTSWDCTTNDVADSVVADCLRRAGLAHSPALKEAFEHFDARAFQFVLTARPASSAAVPAPPVPDVKPLRTMELMRTTPEEVSEPAEGGLRVLQVVHQFLPHNTAGTEIYCADLSFALRRRGHAVRVLAGALVAEHAGSSVLWEGDVGIGVEKILATRHYRRMGAIGGFFDRFDNPEGRAAIRSVLHRMRPDVVQVQHLLYLSAELFTECEIRGIPIVVMLNDYWFLCHRVKLRRRDGSLCDGPARGSRCSQCLNLPGLARSNLNPLALGSNLYRYAYLRRQLLKADRILAPSRYLRDVFIRNGIPAERIVHCDYGTATPPPELAARFAQDRQHRPFRFGFLGTLMYDKGVHVLIDAFQELPPGAAELHVFGLAVETGYVEGLRARARHPDIHWRGPVTHAERWNALAEVDVLVVPSVWYENSPLTIHEALMARVPVIGSDIGGIPELVRHEENGLTFPVGDARALAVCMRMALEEPAKVSAWRRAIVPPKTMTVHVDEIEAMYRDVRAKRAGLKLAS
jgi:glycosyltransferase involved in cell wall biosynthesis/SAM-dependent methyltransferase